MKNLIMKSVSAILVSIMLFASFSMHLIIAAQNTTFTYSLDFENHNEAVYLNKNTTQTYPANYYPRTKADEDLLPLTGICPNMFTDGTLEIEQTGDHGKVLTMRRLANTLYFNNGYFMVPVNCSTGEILAKKDGKLNFEFDFKYENNWKFGLYITPVSSGKNLGEPLNIIKENSYIDSVGYIGDAVSGQWLHINLTFDLDLMIFSGTVGNYNLPSQRIYLNELEPNISYYKIDVTMSGAGRYASFDNFTSKHEVIADDDLSGADDGEVRTTYINSKGKIGIYPFFYPGSEVADWQCLPNETKPRIHLKRNAGSTSDRTPYFEFETYNVDRSIQSYVYEIDVYPKKFTDYTGHKVSLFNVYDSEDSTKNDTPLMIDNNTLCYDGQNICSLPQGTWSRVSCVVDLTDGTFDVYVNCVLQKSNISYREKIIPKKVRIALNWGNRETEYYFDYIKLYEGNSLSSKLDTFVSDREINSDASAILGSASVFMKNTDSIHIGGVKTTYSESGFAKMVRNDVLYVSEDAAMAAFDCQASQLLQGAVQKDGVMYIPLAETAKRLGKYAYEDPRGWICVGDADLKLSNSISSGKSSEQSDVIDRYMHFARPSGDDIYNLLAQNASGTHPRIFTNNEELAKLKNDILTNDFKKTGAAEVICQAEEILTTDLTAYEISDGIRLFLPCLTVRNNLITLTTAYMIADNAERRQAYFDRIWAELNNVCTVWKDWNVEKHYLDAGKLNVGIALAYDVCYDELGSEKRAIIRDAILNKFLYYACASYAGGTRNYNIGKSTVNWGAVCNGGALLLCLATMDDPGASVEYKALCKFVAAEALQGLEYPIGCTFPDGAWSEGLSYYGYVVEYLSWSANALQKCCGTDFGIMSYPGVARMPFYALYVQSIGNGFFNYSDGASDSTGSYVPSELFLMARLLGDTELNDMLYNFKFNILGEKIYTSQFIRDFIFYTPGQDSDLHTSYPLDSQFGNLEISVMKGGWGKNDAYVASIGGITDVNSHYDKGSFIFDMLGERWAIDLGKDDYNIEGGYYGELGDTIYRKRAEGHNTLVFNPDEDPGQISGAMSHIKDFAYGEKEAYAIYDLSQMYSDNCTYAYRGFLLGDNRETLLIQDEFELKNESNEIYWFMHTRANVNVVDDNTVTLTQNGQSVKLDFITNLDSSLSVMDAVGLPSSPERAGQASNEGIRKICLNASGSGEGYVTVKITPIKNDSSYSNITYVPLADWNIQQYHPEITDVELSCDDGHVSASFNARSRSCKGFKVIAAFYDDDNTLLSLATENLNSSAQREPKLFQCMADNNNATKVKIMIWEDDIYPLIGETTLNLSRNLN